jgi:hypothetical protein
VGDLISSIAAFLVFGALCAWLGWLIHSAITENAEFRARERRDREWDERHGIRHD